LADFAAVETTGVAYVRALGRGANGTQKGRKRHVEKGRKSITVRQESRSDSDRGEPPNILNEYPGDPDPDAERDLYVFSIMQEEHDHPSTPAYSSPYGPN
jgi:hypothetical protein